MHTSRSVNECRPLVGSARSAADATALGQSPVGSVPAPKKRTRRYRSRRLDLVNNSDTWLTEVLSVYDSSVLQDYGAIVATRSLEQLKKDAAKLQERIAFIEQSEEKYMAMAERIKSMIIESGLDPVRVIKLLTGAPKTRAAPGSQVKKAPESADATGAMPERGKTYKHSSWPEPWTATGKRTPKHVRYSISAKGHNKTWQQLVAK